MALSRRLISSHFPYVPLHIDVHQSTHTLEALLDTGFDGYLALPPTFFPAGEPPDGYLPCRLADGSGVLSPYYRGVVEVGGLASLQALIIALGDEPLVGRGVADRFSILLNHGQ
jgi:predicted aspartyl protease